MDDINFRTAADEERQDVEALVKQCGKFVRDYFGLRNLAVYWAKGQVFVADTPAGELVAFAVAPDLVRHPWTTIHEIGVHPNWRRLGVGARFVRFLCAMSPHHSLRLVCDVRNEPALALYGSMGFKQLGARENRRGDTIVDLEMTCGSR